MSADSTILAELLADAEQGREHEREEARQLRAAVAALMGRFDALEARMQAMTEAARTMPAAPAPTPTGSTKSIKLGKRTFSVTVTGRDENERIESFEAVAK